MKAIMISIKPKWCALMMNGIKKTEVRKNKALANAIQKLIDEYGYAEIYVYCSKDKRKHYHLIEVENKEYEVDYYIGGKGYLNNCLDGKVVFKFRCYKVEEMYYCDDKYLKPSCLSIHEMFDYLKDKCGYAINISDLEIFDKPKELSEFYKVGHYEDLDDYFTDEKQINSKWCIPLKKAPQNMVYIEV